MLERSAGNERIFCKRCHRELKDPDAKIIGYGKICYCKIRPLHTNYLFEVNYEITKQRNL